MAGYGMTDPKAAAAINALAAKNNAAAAAKPYTTPSPYAYGMNNTKAAAAINTQSLRNNVNSTASGGYGMNNVAAANYINQLAKTTPARAQTGTTVKNPTWAPISSSASYQLPASFDYSSLATHFGLNKPTTAWNFGGSGGSSGGTSGVSSGLSGLSSIAAGGGSMGGLGGMGSMLGGGMGGLGGMSGIGSALGGALGGGSMGGGTGAPPAEEKEPDKPIPQRHWAGGYTAQQQAAMDQAGDNYSRAKLKAGYDAENIASFKGMQGYDDLKKDRVKQAQQLAERQGGQYDTEGNFYSRDVAGKAIEEDNKKRAQQDANYYDIPDGAVPIAAGEGDKKPPGSAAGSGGSKSGSSSSGKSGLDSDWLKKLGGMASSWFGGR